MSETTSYQEERQQREAATHDLARAVAEHLKGWRYKDARNQDQQFSWRATLSGPKGAEVTMSLTNYPASQEGRVYISGAFPPGGWVTERERKNITCAVKRGPEAIAREIERRLLSRYLPAYTRICRRLKEAERDRRERKAMMKRLAKLCGAKLHEASGGYNFYLNAKRGQSYRIMGAECGDDTIDLRIEGLNEKLAGAIIRRLLAGGSSRARAKGGK